MRGPNTDFRAVYSFGSPTGVEVACALMCVTSSGEASADLVSGCTSSSMLLPAADYNVYRGGTRLPAGDGARPPIGASPGPVGVRKASHSPSSNTAL